MKMDGTIRKPGTIGGSVGGITVGCLLVTSLCLGAERKDWPHYLGPDYNLKPESSGLNLQGVEPLWQRKVTTGMCSVSLADGRLYTMGNNGTKENKEEAEDIVYCLDAGSGEEIWTFRYKSLLDPRLHPGGPSSTPTIHDGKVYTLSKFGIIYCLDAESGEEQWTASAESFKPRAAWWGFSGSPTVVGDLVIFNIGDKGLGLHRSTGDILWKSEEKVVGYSTPKPLPQSMLNRSAVALFNNNRFLAVDPETGHPVATYDRPWKEKSNCNAITPFLHQGSVFLFHSGHGLARLSLDGVQFKQDWLSEGGKYPNEWFAFNTPVIEGNNLYFLTKDNKPGGTGLACVDLESGERVGFDNQIDFGNLLQVGDTTVMLSEKGELIWGNLKGNGFNESGRKKILEGLCWSVPVVVQNRLFARDAEGMIVGLELK